ncbi:hypothetical protein RhiirA5_431478 [Rhizophagus irregularis]|uniref:SHSP domain-containing protein n=1 Tax=Rhizophagus irregularis TaxID=588596 RepID=A0A2N0NUV6_9GLOM|nr:hypothetical protein RhiirA5_431478 [Rhizophagus irregularis]
MEFGGGFTFDKGVLLSFDESVIFLPSFDEGVIFLPSFDEGVIFLPSFDEEVDGKKFKIGQESEKELTIHFFPLVRKKQAEYKTVDSNYGPSHNLYNLYDDGTIFSLYINIPTINNKDKISLYVDDDDKVVIISGEYKNINIVEGNHCIKTLIPTSRFETKIPLPSRIDLTKKVKIEKVDAISLFKITFTKGEGYKKRRLSIE